MTIVEQVRARSKRLIANGLCGICGKEPSTRLPHPSGEAGSTALSLHRFIHRL
jgi:hypothetical protein